MNELKAKHSNLHVLALGNRHLINKKSDQFFHFNCLFENFHIADVTDYASFDGFAKKINEIVKNEGLNVLLNNAGVFLEKGKPEATRDDLTNTFEINSVAPIMLTRVSRFFRSLLDTMSHFI